MCIAEYLVSYVVIAITYSYVYTYKKIACR